jgi:NAD(P)-dependent dehydrogenase (short-subunit alcohol dehydrogenase family)
VSASKAALRNFTRTLAAEPIGRNIRVNAVSPGVIAETALSSASGVRLNLLHFGNSCPK